MVQAEARDALFVASDSRSNFKQVIAKRSDLVEFAGGRMKKSAASTIVTHEAGLVLGLASSGADSGFYKPYSDVATDGSQVAVGVLSEQAVVDDSAGGQEIVIIKQGCLYEDLLIGLDAAAKVDLRASSYVEKGVNLIKVIA